MPQPTAAPASFKPTSPPAIARKDVIIPSEEAIKLIRTVRSSAPPWETTPRIFNDITGSTQGIRFKISPPRRAKARIVGKENGRVLVMVGADLPSVTVSVRSADRAPSLSVSRRLALTIFAFSSSETGTLIVATTPS